MAIDIVEGLKAIGETRSADGNSPPPGAFDIKCCEIQHGDGHLYDISSLVMEIHTKEVTAPMRWVIIYQQSIYSRSFPLLAGT